MFTFTYFNLNETIAKFHNLNTKPDLHNTSMVALFHNTNISQVLLTKIKLVTAANNGAVQQSFSNFYYMLCILINYCVFLIITHQC